MQRVNASGEMNGTSLSHPLSQAVRARDWGRLDQNSTGSLYSRSCTKSSQPTCCRGAGRICEPLPLAEELQTGEAVGKRKKKLLPAFLKDRAPGRLIMLQEMAPNPAVYNQHKLRVNGL